MDTYKEMKAVVTSMQYEAGANPDRPAVYGCAVRASIIRGTRSGKICPVPENFR